MKSPFENNNVSYGNNDLIKIYAVLDAPNRLS